MKSKKEIRTEAKGRVKSILDSQAVLSEIAGKRAYEFLESLDLSTGTSIGLFLSMKDTEIETSPLIDLLRASSKHYRILVPKVEDETTILFYPYEESAPHRISKYGIWEPLVDVSEAVVPEVIIVPGLAFDRKGGRVGHGKGYYDRYFERNAEKIRMRVAFAFETQVFEEVPMNEFDLPMQALITDQSVTVF